MSYEIGTDDKWVQVSFHPVFSSECLSQRIFSLARSFIFEYLLEIITSRPVMEILHYEYVAIYFVLSSRGYDSGTTSVGTSLEII